MAISSASIVPLWLRSIILPGMCGKRPSMFLRMRSCPTMCGWLSANTAAPANVVPMTVAVDDVADRLTREASCELAFHPGREIRADGIDQQDAVRRHIDQTPPVAVAGAPEITFDLHEGARRPRALRSRGCPRARPSRARVSEARPTGTRPRPVGTLARRGGPTLASNPGLARHKQRATPRPLRAPASPLSPPAPRSLQ